MQQLLRKLVLILVVTLASKLSMGQEKPVQLNYVPSGDTKWTMFGINRGHVQDFGTTEQYSPDTCNCTESTKGVFGRANVNFGISVYRSFSKRLAASADLTLGYGYVSVKDNPVASAKSRLQPTVHADLYYHFMKNNLQIQPYLFGGLHSSQKLGVNYVTVPVGLGARYMVFNDNGMVTAQAGYGFGMTNNLRNSLMFSWGLYVNMSKKKREPGEGSSMTASERLLAGTCVSAKDSDCDGVVDDKDKCPKVAGPVSNDGCPESGPDGKSKDKDHDGITDDKDKCPDVAGAVSNMGCPIEDRDHDGVIDSKDNCPDMAGPVSNDGCPISDRDGDGIIDSKDKCPDVAGNVNNDGCPGAPAASGVGSGASFGGGFAGSSNNAAGQPSEELTPNRIVPGKDNKDTMLFIVYFNFDKYDLDLGFGVLNKLKDYLRANAGYKILLTGHTDLEGDAEYNMKLSSRRVSMVRKFLISYYIDPSRITTSYFGKQDPVVPNKDRDQSWKNRRVEVKVYQ